MQLYSFLDYSSISVAYLEPYQASMMERFLENSSRLLAASSKYASV